MNRKKQLCLALLLATATLAQAQKAKISGDIKGLGDTEVYIGYLKNNSHVTDTIQIKKDKFTWEATIPEPQKVYMMFPSQYVDFFIEQGNIKITGKAESLHELKAVGSKVQAEADAYQATLQDLQDRSAPLYEKWGSGSEEEQLKLEQELEEIRIERRSRNSKYIAAHPKSFYSFSMVADQATMGSYEEVKPVYDLLDQAIFSTATGKALTKRLEVLQRGALGSDMLAFTQNDQHGNPVSFTDFEGKYVLVDFWASWCGPCRAENPNVLKAYNNYKDKNFTVIGISLDDNAEKWKKAIQDDGMPWTQVSSLNGFDNEVSTYYGIQGIPSTLLVDPAGKIIARDLRGASLQQKLAEIFE